VIYDYGYICVDFPPKINAGSVRNSFFVDGLIGNHNSVIIFTNYKNIQYNISKINTNPGSNKDRNLIRVFREVVYGIELFFKIIFSKKCRHYIVTPPPFLLNIFSVLAIKLKGGTYTLDIRDLYPEVYFINGVIKRDSLLGRFLTFIEQWLYKNSSSIVTVTNGIKENIIKRQPGLQVSLVRNGYDRKLFSPLDENKKRKIFTVVFHGNLGRFQNINLLADVIKRINRVNSDVQFLVIGDGCNAEKIMNLKVNNLSYSSTIDHYHVARIIAECHLGLSFRTSDFISKASFPVKIFEYIGVGLPVLSTPKSEAGEVLEKFGFGFQFDNNNVDKIVDQILAIKNNFHIFNKDLEGNFSRQNQFKLFYKSVQIKRDV
jgi:glycosyltransferase involved in cell wall biosynthesis